MRTLPSTQGAGLFAMQTHNATLTKDEILDRYAFGKTQWEQLIGYTGEQPPISDEIQATMNQPCPFDPRRRVCDTHCLVLIPNDEVNGSPVNLKVLCELFENLLNLGSSYEKLREVVEAAPQGGPYWVLMTKAVVPNSKFITYERQVEMFNGNELPGYSFPKLLEALICAGAYSIKFGSQLFSDHSPFTRCEELVDGKWPVCIGRFSPTRYHIFSDQYEGPEYDFSLQGVTAVKRFAC